MAETTVGILVQRQCLSAIPAFGQIYLGAKTKKTNKKATHSLWLSRGSCFGLLTREWGFPAELITACLHEHRRNTSSSTHNILILLSSPSVPPPSTAALICNRAHCEGGVYVHNQIRAFAPLFPHQTSKSITVLLMKAQALTGRQDIRNSTFTMLQIYGTFDGALTRPHAGPCSHLDVSICGKNVAHSPPRSVPPPRTSAKAGRQDASITAHQGDDIIAHWQGYLSEDREMLEVQLR